MSEALFGAVAGKAIGFGLSKLFGPKARQPATSFLLSDLTTPAFRFDLGATRGGISPTLTRRRTVEAGFSPEQAGIFGRLRALEGEVRPGFGRFTEAARRTIQDAASRRLGTLREQLRQKRVSGASFAEDLITRTALDFAQQEEKAVAQAGLSEIAESLRIIDQQNQMLISQINTDLAELGVASNIVTQISNVGMQINQLEQAADAERIAEANESLFGFGAELGEVLQGVIFGDKDGQSPAPRSGFDPSRTLRGTLSGSSFFGGII